MNHSDTQSSLLGAVHVHTDLSHDGIHTLGELKQLFQRRGYQFACLNDHSQDVSPEQYSELRRQCQLLSDKDFAFIPGLEYSCDGEIHIMGIGISERSPETNPEAVIDSIHRLGGIAVLSHPSKSSRYVFDDCWVRKLDGAEIWNRAVDSLLVPQTRSIDLFLRFRKINPQLLAFFGLDLHREHTFADIGLSVFASSADQREIVEALRAGSFVCRSRYFSMSPRSSLGFLKRRLIGLTKIVFNLVRRVRATWIDRKSIPPEEGTRPGRVRR